MVATTTNEVPVAREDPKPRVSRARRSRFYLITSLIIAVVVLLGFEHTFFLRPLFKNPPLTPLAWTHGVVFSGWVAILIAQATLVLRGGLRWHRRLGWFAALYASGMVILGAAVLIASEQRSLHSVGDTSHAHSALKAFVPFLGDMGLFGGLAAAGVALRRSPEVHKRLMILATVALLDAAFGRFGYLFPIISTIPFAWRDYGSTDLAAVVILLADWRHCGRPHPAYLVSIPVMIAWHSSLVLIGQSAIGLKAASFIVSRL